MTILVDALPKDENGQIVFDPAGEMGGQYYAGTVGTGFFTNVFPQYANAELPCTTEVYEGMKALDKFWFINTVNWRKAGVIQVQGIAQDELVEEEEAIVNPPVVEEEEPPVEEEQGAV